MNKQALVTLVLGRQYLETFNTWFRPGWERYCSIHGLDLIVIDQPLDVSPRAQNRSPAWQKCLIHRFPAVSRYEQVAWVDADIRIRPSSPNIFANLAPDMIGAVNAYATPTKEDHDMALQKVYQQYDKLGARYVRNLTPQEFHGHFGLEAPYDGVVQTGVMVFSPQVHGEVFQKTYDSYEDKGDAIWNHEMRPLSYEILKAGAIQWISPKFNMSWYFYQEFFYPFLFEVESATLDSTLRLRRECLKCAFQNNYYLHFVGERINHLFLPANAE